MFRYAFTFTDRLTASDNNANVQTAMCVVIGWTSVI